MKHVLVYGTLRCGGASELVKVPGFKMYDLGWFPGIRPGGPDDFILAERHEIVDDAHEMDLDSLEGWHEESPQTSLYLKEQYNGDVIYVYNGEVAEEQRIMDGDWLRYMKQEKGSNSSLMFRHQKEVA